MWAGGWEERSLLKTGVWVRAEQWEIRQEGGGAWCGASEPGLSPADTPGGSSFLGLHQVCRENKMGGGQEGEGRQWEWEAAMVRGLGRVRIQRAHLLSPA